MPNELKELPTFKNEEEEREFWATQDSTEYINWDEAEAIILPKLKPSTRTISLRMPELMLNELRVIANKRDIPYQSLIKIFLKDRIDQELKRDTENRMALSAE
jgi:predicted DNA binding CopG/RHH family protein